MSDVCVRGGLLGGVLTARFFIFFKKKKNDKYIKYACVYILGNCGASATSTCHHLSFSSPQNPIIMETTRSQIKSTLRLLWLRSKERAQALKNSGYCCEDCGVKQSVAKGKEQKVEVHHIKGIGNWDKVIDLIKQEILCDPKDLKVLCPDCHDKVTYGQ